jgi:hypothetical protein
MRIAHLTGALATVILTALPAAAQTATGAGAPDVASLPSNVLWAAGVAAFLGFMLGSFPPNDRDSAVKWDMSGALVWALAAAALVGGLFLYGSTHELFPAVYGVGFGALMGGLRLLTTRPPRQPKNYAAKNGVTRFDGENAKAKYKAAQKLYNNASFQNGNWYATRGRDWRYNDGVPASLLEMLADSARSPSSEQLAILVFLVRELPGEPGEPAVIVVNGGEALRQMKVDRDGILVPGYDKKVPANVITGMVGYAWR